MLLWLLLNLLFGKIGLCKLLLFYYIMIMIYIYFFNVNWERVIRFVIRIFRVGVGILMSDGEEIDMDIVLFICCLEEEIKVCEKRKFFLFF